VPRVRRIVAALLLAAALLLVAAALPVTVAVTASAARRTEVIAIRAGGVERGYRLFVPSGLSRGRHPLLLALHYLHSDARRFETLTGFDAGAQRRGVLVAYPDGLHGSWNAGTCCAPALTTGVDDVGFLAAVVADVERREPVDPSRIAVTGFSNGALMAYRLVCSRPEVVAVAAVAAGDLLAPACPASRAVALLHVHGALDRVIPLAGEAWSPLDPLGFPAAVRSVERVAAADGCTGATTRSAGPGLTVWSASGCRGGGAVRMITVAGLAHQWWVRMTATTWAFVGACWQDPGRGVSVPRASVPRASVSGAGPPDRVGGPGLRPPTSADAT
jgi:polyhydroxybutyrate depolymerase